MKVQIVKLKEIEVVNVDGYFKVIEKSSNSSLLYYERRNAARAKFRFN